MNFTAHQKRLLEIAKQCGMSFDDWCLEQYDGADVYFNESIAATLEKFADLSHQQQPNSSPQQITEKELTTLIDDLLEKCRADEAYAWQEETAPTDKKELVYAKQLEAARDKLIYRILGTGAAN